MIDQAYVYIMASTYKRLYIGVTSEIELRVLQHKQRRYPDSFTSRYKIDRLVYIERFGMIDDAIARETQLKKWSRIKKMQLIVASNPTWQDLSADWGKPIKPGAPFMQPHRMSGHSSKARTASSRHRCVIPSEAEEPPHFASTGKALP